MDIASKYVRKWFIEITCFFSDILAKALYRRHVDSSTTGMTGVKSSAANFLAPTIAPVPAPPTVGLVEQHVSRKRMRAAEI